MVPFPPSPHHSQAPSGSSQAVRMCNSRLRRRRRSWPSSPSRAARLWRRRVEGRRSKLEREGLVGVEWGLRGVAGLFLLGVRNVWRDALHAMQMGSLRYQKEQSRLEQVPSVAVCILLQMVKSVPGPVVVFTKDLSS